MEPITTAIVAAVAAGITDIGPKAFGDYQGLKDSIKSKFGQDNKVSKAIAELEDKPESKGRQSILAESIAHEKADREQAVAKYQIDARDAPIGVAGDKAHIGGWVHFYKVTAGTAFGVLCLVNGIGDLFSSPAATLWMGGVGTIKRYS